MMQTQVHHPHYHPYYHRRRHHHHHYRFSAVVSRAFPSIHPGKMMLMLLMLLSLLAMSTAMLSLLRIRQLVMVPLVVPLTSASRHQPPGTVLQTQ